MLYSVRTVTASEANISSRLGRETNEFDIFLVYVLRSRLVLCL